MFRSILVVLTLLGGLAAAQEQAFVRLVDQDDHPVADALVQVQGLSATEVGLLTWYGPPELDPTTGRTDRDGRFVLGFLDWSFRVRLGATVDLGLRLLVLERDGRLSTIPIATLSPGATVRLERDERPSLSLVALDGRPLAGATVEWFGLGGLVLPRLFRGSGRLVQTADDDGRLALPGDFSTGWFRLAHPLVGDGLEFLARSVSGSFRFCCSTAGRETWTLRLDAEANRPWSLKLERWRAFEREGAPRLPQVSWRIELAPGESRLLRERPDHISLDCLEDGLALEPGLGSDENDIICRERRWTLCRGRFLNVGDGDPPVEVDVKLRRRLGPVSTTVTSRARVADDRVFAIPHPGDASPIGWRLEGGASWPHLAVPPNFDLGGPLVEIDLAPFDTRPAPSLLGPTDKSEHFVHQVSGRVRRADGSPAAFQPILVTVEDPAISFDRKLASDERNLPRRAFVEPPPRAANDGILAFCDADGRFRVWHEGMIYALRFGYDPKAPKGFPATDREEREVRGGLRLRTRYSKPLEIDLPD